MESRIQKAAYHQPGRREGHSRILSDRRGLRTADAAEPILSGPKRQCH